MPILFWLPIIFASALFEIAASPSMPEGAQNIRMSKKHDEMTKLTDGTHSYGPDEAANLKAQIADQKQVINSLRAQLADMHEQMDRSHSRADRISLTASY
jgi:septal ring factor EnvC (AmiA/AmiB activator)